MKARRITTPSLEGQKQLDALRKSVANVLERKRRLGQYAVTWENGKPVVRGEDAPVVPARAR
ncbi:MAG: hypothetical protein LK562_18510 [Candidatus Accumulibacter phosphatis]|nr:hypothetical protein [Candidatus Accumulibacter phosphatis]